MPRMIVAYMLAAAKVVIITHIISSLINNPILLADLSSVDICSLSINLDRVGDSRHIASNSAVLIGTNTRVTALVCRSSMVTRLPHIPELSLQHNNYYCV